MYRNRKRGARTGDYKAYCDRSGFRLFASECQIQWDGIFVRKKYWEARHPQEVIKAKPEHLVVPIARPGSREEKTVNNPPFDLF